jgi:hypothetical protein
MKQKNSKLAVALFLLRNPGWSREFLRRVKINTGRKLLPPPMGRGRPAAEAWAAQQAVSEATALERLSMDAKVLRTLEQDFPGLFAEAASKEASAKEKMGGGGSADLIYGLCEALQVRTAVETGVAYGYSSLAILSSVAKRGGRLASVDMPHIWSRDRSQVGIVVPDALRSSWTLLQCPDSIGLERAIRVSTPLDFCHYDSDKSYEGRSWGYRLMWNALRHGGLFMSDDIGDNTAFRDFSVEVGAEAIVIDAPGAGASGRRFIGLMRKI